MITPKQLHILRHSLGYDDEGLGTEYRNHFCTGAGSTDFDDCAALAAAGLMIDGGPQAVYGGSHYFIVSEAGKAEVASRKPAKPVLTKSQQRYRSWLYADSGMKFGDWLKFHSGGMA